MIVCEFSRDDQPGPGKQTGFFIEDWPINHHPHIIGLSIVTGYLFERPYTSSRVVSGV